MTTTIRNQNSDGNSIELTALTRSDVAVSHWGAASASVDRSEFLAAVATELDVLVIPRTDLPNVDPEVNGRGAEVGGDYIECADADDARTVGLRYLALAEYLDAHPPIDQAQVDALAAEIERAIHDSGVGADEVHPGEIAHRLIATGRVTLTPDGGAS